MVAYRVPFAPGREDRFEQRLRQRAGQTEQQAGFVSMQVLRPKKEDAPYLVSTTRRDRAAFEPWVGGEDFRPAHRNSMSAEAFGGGGKQEMHQVIITADGE